MNREAQSNWFVSCNSLYKQYIKVDVVLNSHYTQETMTFRESKGLIFLAVLLNYSEDANV